MDTYLASGYKVNDFVISKPKKNGDFLICRIKHNGEPIIVQFPKMCLSDDPIDKGFSMEFLNNKNYNKEIYTFLSDIDHFIIEHIHKNSQEWFNKTIPLESLKMMYNSFIKAPRTAESKCRINFSYSQTKTSFIDKKGNEVSKELFKKNETVECISQFRYIIFSKDTCFPVWEMVSVKIHKKHEKVGKFGFVEDPDDTSRVESDDEIESNIGFF